MVEWDGPLAGWDDARSCLRRTSSRPGLSQTGSPGLYLLPGDCLTQSCPTVTPAVIVEATQTDSYFVPVWSPDGMSLYFCHISAPANSQVATFSVERVPAAGGTPELLIPNATWPRPSPDGTTLAYVAFDLARSINDLYFAAPDGTNGRPAMPPGSFISVDAPLFSPDGQYIYFSGAGAARSRRWEIWPDHRTWLERLIGVQPAYANGMPSEWWRLPVAGGAPTRLTGIAASGLSGTFSPDGQFFAFISYSGMAIMTAERGTAHLDLSGDDARKRDLAPLKRPQVRGFGSRQRVEIVRTKRGTGSTWLDGAVPGGCTQLRLSLAGLTSFCAASIWPPGAPQALGPVSWPLTTDTIPSRPCLDTSVREPSSGL